MKQQSKCNECGKGTGHPDWLTCRKCLASAYNRAALEYKLLKAYRKNLGILYEIEQMRLHLIVSREQIPGKISDFVEITDMVPDSKKRIKSYEDYLKQSTT